MSENQSIIRHQSDSKMADLDTLYGPRKEESNQTYDECFRESFYRIKHEFPCDECGLKFVSKSKLKYDERMQHEVHCDECGQACQAGFMPSGQDILNYQNKCAKELTEKAETIGKLIKKNDKLKLTIKDLDKEVGERVDRYFETTDEKETLELSHQKKLKYIEFLENQ